MMLVPQRCGDTRHTSLAFLQIAAGLTQRQIAGAADAIVGFDVVADSAAVIVVMNERTRQLRPEGRNLRHSEAFLCFEIEDRRTGARGFGLRVLANRYRPGHDPHGAPPSHGMAARNLSKG